MTDIMFVCAHNAIRSQIAVAFFNHLKTQTGIKGVSAGITPAPEVPQFVLDTMLEVGLDLSGITPVKISPELTATVSTIITLGCSDLLTPVPGVKTADWNITFPKTVPAEDARKLRDGIEAKVKEFIAENNY
ncbi:hypothetical protein BGZ70_005879 [Mortierella alpina]|uniref:Phosphotyrosine protein phosphatase I domain-containing protein n=1 Tax=Mortierella alpina TaxID=64518 RepID=A0A9P6IPT0_MORAP|nr:hypothetical protein BGZ70_005879 [Mortierella alpina]